MIFYGYKSEGYRQAVLLLCYMPTKNLPWQRECERSAGECTLAQKIAAASLQQLI